LRIGSWFGYGIGAILASRLVKSHCSLGVVNDGLTGPGTGSFFSWAGVAIRGQTLLTATAHAKAFNFMSNLASVAVFVVGGQVLWSIGLCMMLGQMLGAGLATVVMVKKGLC